jgi:hypothetical protein
VSCEKNCSILAAQRTSIARLMTTITSSDPQRHRRIPSTPLCRPTDRIFFLLGESDPTQSVICKDGRILGSKNDESDTSQNLDIPGHTNIERSKGYGIHRAPGKYASRGPLRIGAQKRTQWRPSKPPALSVFPGPAISCGTN